jgi:hypothetical protein
MSVCVCDRHCCYWSVRLSWLPTQFTMVGAVLRIANVPRILLALRTFTAVRLALVTASRPAWKSLDNRFVSWEKLLFRITFLGRTITATVSVARHAMELSASACCMQDGEGVYRREVSERYKYQPCCWLKYHLLSPVRSEVLDKRLSRFAHNLQPKITFFLYNSWLLDSANWHLSIVCGLHSEVLFVYVFPLPLFQQHNAAELCRVTRRKLLILVSRQRWDETVQNGHEQFWYHYTTWVRYFHLYTHFSPTVYLVCDTFPVFTEWK